MTLGNFTRRYWSTFAQTFRTHKFGNAKVDIFPCFVCKELTSLIFTRRPDAVKLYGYTIDDMLKAVVLLLDVLCGPCGLQSFVA